MLRIGSGGPVGRHLAALVALALTACGESPADVTPDPDPVQDPAVGSYLTGLPAWDAFSPLLAVQARTEDGAPTALPPDTVINVRDYTGAGDDDEGVLIPSIVYQCQDVPYTMTDNPQEIVMYSPDVDILWPGGLIQGASHADGLGNLLPITIAQRAAMDVSIPRLATGDNFRTVDQPNLASVNSAIGAMVGSATTADLSVASDIFFEQEVYHSEEQFALSVGISGSYMGFSGSASSSFSQNAAETTVTVQFAQKMFEVVVAPPQTPAGFFGTGFTDALLQQQVTAGNVGPDNPPIYVSSVVYGRMMAFSFTSTASETEIRATLNASYSSFTGGVDFKRDRQAAEDPGRGQDQRCNDGRRRAGRAQRHP